MPVKTTNLLVQHIFDSGSFYIHPITDVCPYCERNELEMIWDRREGREK